ncbi:endonuclease III-like protein 1 [Dinothrombium tinctorium]|uniref:Endonuclease III homolog n=1 Tax=Dinothrombium tinctorium TaxID=1965070 RepID=A0A443RR21_9ACAR|nr:endonuclease III-like protein 1 [Dinothrombium tinctorium]
MVWCESRSAVRSLHLYFRSAFLSLKVAPNGLLFAVNAEMATFLNPLAMAASVGSELPFAMSQAKNGKIEHLTIEWEPPNWRLALNNIKQMRKMNAAPVDSMGCDQCYDKQEISEKIIRFQILVSLLLSSQTKDTTTFAAMNRLKQRGLSIESICEIDESELGELIKPVGFWRTKAKHLKKVAEILRESYDGDIPRSLEELTKLPGIGPKMGLLAMRSAWNEMTGIAVDTHVHRISNRLGWVRKATKKPEQTRKELESWLPKSFWAEINHDLVGFGQTICSAKNPQCNVCLNKPLCPFASQIPNKTTKRN